MSMAASEFTRQAIIRGTKHLAAEKPFHKISVLEIVRYCQINRNTFYYYFGDKYDVIQWIFDNEIAPVLNGEQANESLAKSVSALCSHLCVPHLIPVRSRCRRSTGSRHIYR